MATEIATHLEYAHLQKAAEAGGPGQADLSSIVADCRRMRIHATRTQADASTSSSGGPIDSVDDDLDSVLDSMLCVPDGLSIPAPRDVESVDADACAAGTKAQEGSVPGSRTDA